MRKWRIEDSEELYNITGWGVSYFGINDKGHVVVTPRKNGVAVDLPFPHVLEEIKRAPEVIEANRGIGVGGGHPIDVIDGVSPEKIGIGVDAADFIRIGVGAGIDHDGRVDPPVLVGIELLGRGTAVLGDVVPHALL